MSTTPYLNEAHKRFERELKVLEQTKNLKALMIENIDIDETPNPNINDFRNLRKIFIKETTENKLADIMDELGMVGRDDEDDPFTMITTRHSLEFYRIFNKYIRKSNRLYTTSKFAQCFDIVIGLIFGLKEFQIGFHDTEDVEEGQRIINKIAKLFKNIIQKNGQEIGIAENEKPILFQLCHQVHNQYNQDHNYTFNVGRYQPPDDNDDDDDEDDDIDTNHRRSRKRYLDNNYRTSDNQPSAKRRRR